jgi:hypothetical protein
VNLRKLIREQIEKVLNKETFDQDIKYLDGFTLNKKENKSGVTVWVFEHKSKNYIIRFYIQKDASDSWQAKVFVYWKTASEDYTNAKGKDFDYQYGPFNTYEEMIEELNRKLKNNPLISHKNYIDDNRTQFDNDVVEMVKRLQKQGEALAKVKDSYFNDLKKIYNEVKGIEDEQKIREFIKKKAPDEEDKQNFLLIVQKISLLDFYNKKEEIDFLFT